MLATMREEKLEFNPTSISNSSCCVLKSSSLHTHTLSLDLSSPTDRRSFLPNHAGILRRRFNQINSFTDHINL
ncbi:hypothetical protein QVD17_31255 [Tagetes erecta]|uniref:Uncharacterized protein n=1 Tax=Tagetes erecta TaxID=13708 RepID=A0AAD8NP60_TARER|nr:hypothetical protein QVD17_31255 [Tagetes erecta]